MSLKVSFDYVKKDHMVSFEENKERVSSIDKMINERTGEGHEFLGWVDYPVNYDKEEFERIIKKAEEFRNKYDVLVVCGIGGSYLGARAAIDACNGVMPKRGRMQVLYLGNTLDPNYSHEILEYIKDRNFCVCVISKSGTTTETSVSFRILKEMLEDKYGKEGARDAIVAVTDKEKGALKSLANTEGYETYVLPDDIGGRFSVMTPVGLFPIACAGIDIRAFMKGLQDAREEYSSPDIYKNQAYQYALQRNYLYEKLNYHVEMIASYEMRLKTINEWRKQLFDESEGKLNKAVLTTSATFTTDLHSLGQFIQEGSKILYETIIYVDNPSYDVTVPFDRDDLDGLNYLAGKNLSYINRKAYEGTLKAHSETGNIPNICINLDKIDAYNIAYLFYFFMKACAMSAYLLGVNPFNQPGVEVYKKNMFHLLGKKGY